MLKHLVIGKLSIKQKRDLLTSFYHELLSHLQGIQRI